MGCIEITLEGDMIASIGGLTVTWDVLKCLFVLLSHYQDPSLTVTWDVLKSSIGTSLKSNSNV